MQVQFSGYDTMPRQKGRVWFKDVSSCVLRLPLAVNIYNPRKSYSSIWVNTTHNYKGQT